MHFQATPLLYLRKGTVTHTNLLVRHEGSSRFVSRSPVFLSLFLSNRSERERFYTNSQLADILERKSRGKHPKVP